MTAEQIVEQLAPSDGWWKSRTEEVLISTAQQMLDAGMEALDIADILGDIVGAMRAEYGE